MPVSLTMSVAPVALFSMIPPVGPGQIGHRDPVLQRRLQRDRLDAGRRRARERGHLGAAAPEAADPDRMVGIALLELDPHAGADHRQREHAVLDAGDRHARHRPGDGDQAGDVGHLHLQPALLHRIDVVQHHAAVLAVIPAGSAHTGTRGVIEIRPLRVRLKLCLNSPRLSVLVTLCT